MNQEDYEQLKDIAESEYNAEIDQASKRRAERLRAIELVWQLAQGIDAGEATARIQETNGQKKKIGRPPKVHTPNGKECTKCGQWKPYSEYHVDRTSSDGRNSHCKDCRKKLPPTHIDAPLPAHLNGKGHVQRYCSRGRLCLEYPDNEQPGEIPNGSPTSVCPRCSRARAYG